MENEISLKIKISNIYEAIEKADKLISLLKEAKSLADDLATVDMKLLSETDIQRK